MRDLGNDLGILGSSIYAHVGGKQELLVAVVERASELFRTSAAVAVEAGGGPAETLQLLISGHIDVLVDHADEAATFLSEADFLEQPARRRITRVRDTYEAVFRDTIAAGVESGVFRADADPTLSGIYVLSLLNAVQRWFRDNGRLGRADLAADMYRFVLKGLR